jgi:uncharacterized protein with GYD domain
MRPLILGVLGAPPKPTGYLSEVGKWTHPKGVSEEMATYIMLSRLSPEGLTTLKRNPSRLNEVNQEVEQFGARVVQQYALLGAYDFITVLDAPDSETVARISVELGSRRTASYETLTAIPVDEFISSLKG